MDFKQRYRDKEQAEEAHEAVKLVRDYNRIVDQLTMIKTELFNEFQNNLPNQYHLINKGGTTEVAWKIIAEIIDGKFSIVFLDTNGNLLYSASDSFQPPNNFLFGGYIHLNHIDSVGSNTTKRLRLLQEIHHEMSNDLYSIQSEREKKQQLERWAKEAEIETRRRKGISGIIRNFLNDI